MLMMHFILRSVSFYFIHNIIWVKLEKSWDFLKNKTFFHCHLLSYDWHNNDISIVEDLLTSQRGVKSCKFLLLEFVFCRDTKKRHIFWCYKILFWAFKDAEFEQHQILKIGRPKIVGNNLRSTIINFQNLMPNSVSATPKTKFKFLTESDDFKKKTIAISKIFVIKVSKHY